MIITALLIPDTTSVTSLLVKMMLYFGLLKCLLTLVLIQFHVCALVYRSACRKDVLMKVTDRSKKLVGSASNVISSSHAKSLSLCTKKCVDASQCKSQNYKKYVSEENEINCQLLDVNTSSAGVSLSPAVGWVHYEPVSQVTPRCRSATCAAGYVCDETCGDPGYVCKDVNECLSNPCKNGGTCNNLVNSYSCKCLPFYAGTNCDPHMSSCSNHQTAYTEFNGGKLQFLDRQHVNCGGSGTVLLAKFQAQTSGSNIRYNFKCCHFTASFCNYNRVTGVYREIAGGNMDWLDRIDVNCGSNGYVTDFEMKISGNEGRYEYHCCNVESSWRNAITCTDHHTGWVNRINSLTALGRLDVVCNSGYALSYFHFENDVPHYNQQSYSYRCCKVA